MNNQVLLLKDQITFYYYHDSDDQSIVDWKVTARQIITEAVARYLGVSADEFITIFHANDVISLRLKNTCGAFGSLHFINDESAHFTMDKKQ